MKHKISIFGFFIFLLVIMSTAHATRIEEKIITLQSNERFSLIQARKVKFKFQVLSEDARKLEITKGASALGVAYLGQIKLKDDNTALSALRSIADQIGESLDLSLGVIADSNTSDALKDNELLLLYHPNVTITLALAKISDNNEYEIICTYVLKELVKNKPANDTQATEPTSEPNTTQTNPQESTLEEATVEDTPETTTN